MAWVYAYPGASQGSDIPINYYTYRAMRGTVQMRLTDVLIDGGAQWHTARYVVNLIDSAGNVYCNTSLGKTWGVQPAFTTLCYLNVTRALRMQVTAYVYTTSGMVYNTWTSALRWDNLV